MQYPIGRPERPTAPLSDAQRSAMIDAIAGTPARFRAAVAGLDDAQLDTPYRPDGWTVRQVAHHLPDSHVNAYIRTRWALTESTPTIKAYDEAAWAELADARSGPIDPSLAMLEAVHERWVRLLRSLAPEDFGRGLVHPENGPMTLDSILAIYSWHGAHHTAHVTALRERMAW
jgi:uncharacterized damage-inducible protein DinB